MKRETILKIILVLIMGVVLLVRPVNVFAAVDIGEDFWEYQGGLDDIEGETGAGVDAGTDTGADAGADTEPETTPNIPDAGLAENTMMVVVIAVLGITSIYTFKKVNEYKNI